MILPQSDKNLEIQEQVKHMKQEEANGGEPATFVEVSHTAHAPV